MIFIGILFLSALSLSAVAAFYAITGLLTLFPTAGLSIVIMGIALELGKLVSASWLYRNWNNAPAALKYYFTFAVIILSFITSMGIFGYLSKSHIDQKFSFSDSSVIVSNLEREIKSEENNISNGQKSIDILNSLVSQADAKDANFIRNTQRRERDNINSSIRSSAERIKTLNTELTPLHQESARMEAEVGPIKYIADLIYGKEGKESIEKAVRAVIITIVFVFDPLAIILLVAANRELKLYIRYRLPKRKVAAEKLSRSKIDKSKVMVDKDKIFDMGRTTEIPREILDKVFKVKKK
jgi:hypothetical protein